MLILLHHYDKATNYARLTTWPFCYPDLNLYAFSEETLKKSCLSKTSMTSIHLGIPKRKYPSTCEKRLSRPVMI